MVRNIIREAEDLLWRKLMWTRDDKRFEIPLDKLEDDLTWTERGISFIGNPVNDLQDKRAWMLQQAQSDRIGRKMYKNGK
jgi:hypothetical protein